MTAQRFLRRSSLVAILTIGAIGLTSMAAVAITYGRPHALLSAAQTRLTGLVLQFEREIGYGGLIHNFKNAVLRPEQPSYYGRVVENHSVAIGILDQIQEIGRTVGIHSDLGATRTTLDAYRQQADVVLRAHAEGLRPADIDDWVRVSDTDALAEVEELHAQIATAIGRDLEGVEWVLRALLASLLLLTTGATLLLLRHYFKQRENLLEEAQARNEELEAFSQVAAHDLRAPLQQIRTLAQWIREDNDVAEFTLAPGTEAHIQSIERLVARMRAMVEQLLDYIRTGANGAPKSRVDLGAAVREIAELVLPKDVTCTLEGQFPVVRVAPAEVGIVLRNLLGNAVKHGSSDEPRITVRCSRSAGYVVLEVEDNGRGVDPAQRERIFDMWATSVRRDEGTEVHGVGLALVRKVVHGWRGRVSVRDGRQGGALFEVTFPQD